MLTNKKIS